MAEGIINVRADFTEVAGFMKSLRKDMKKVAASSVNRTMFLMKTEDWPAVARTEIDKPTRFTQSKNANRYKKATPSRAVGRFYLSPVQERYLLPQIKGATLRGKVMPSNIRLNRFGNIAGLRGGKVINRLLNRKDHFRDTIGGLDAIWNAQPRA